MKPAPTPEPPGPPGQPQAPAAVACPNCGTPLSEPPPRFCPACGQETRVRPPTLLEFMQQFGGAYLSTEGALWRTLALLLLRPGELTRQYLAGRRKHYVLPLRLYLTISVVVLLVMRLTTAVHFDVKDVQADAELPRNISFNLGMGRAGLREGAFYCDGLPGWLCRRFQQRIDLQPSQMQRAAEAVGERFMSNFGGAMFCLLPIFALLLRLAYWGRGMRYTEHLVFALHLHAFWFLMLGLLMAQQAWLAVPALLAVPAYALLAQKRVYGGRWWPLVLRASSVGVIYCLAMLLILLVVAVWSVLA